MIDVALLGTGGMMPLPKRWLSSVLVRVNGEMTLFDCGEGTQIAWRQTGWGFRRLGTICISHTHADHIAGLPGLLHAIANAQRTEPIDLYGPMGTEAVVRGLRTIAPVLPFEIRVRELSDGERFVLPGGLVGSCAAGEHGLPVLGYRADLARARGFRPDEARRLGIPLSLWSRLQAGERVAWEGGSADAEFVLGPFRPGISLAYVTDTRPVPRLIELVAGVDLLICEGTYGDDADLEKAVRNQHMTFREAATLARDAGAARLWLTHFSPGLDDPAALAAFATDVFPDAVVGRDGLTITLRFRDDSDDSASRSPSEP
jgi:ribonuclease Z